MEDYIKTNKLAWDKKTLIHIDSEFYDNDGFIKGKNSLTHIELALLPDLKDKKVLHLQCHFGQDTLSMARMGANVTGVDLSSTAIQEANKLAEVIGQQANFIESNIYALSTKLNDEFDIVFSTYGVVGWLKDLDQWAQIIYRYLKPGGLFIFAEFHPVVWMYDNDFNKVSFDYFISDIIVEEEKGSYGDRNVDEIFTTMTYNHSLGEVLSALINTGLKITHFDEYPYSPYNCLAHMYKIDDEKYKISKFEKDIPLIYSLVCKKE